MVLKTRIRRKIVGSDYSAQEPRPYDGVPCR